MPTAKKPRNKGITYKLVPRSYADADGDEGPIWVSEAEFYRNHQNPNAIEEEDKARQQMKMYAAAANEEFKEERHRSRRTAAPGDDDDDYDEDGEYYNYEEGEEGEWVDGEWDDEEGEWAEEGEWEEEEEEEEAPARTAPAPAAAAAASAKPANKSVSFATQLTSAAPAASSGPARARGREEKRARDESDGPARNAFSTSASGHRDADDGDQESEEPAGDADGEEGEEAEEKLFEDEVECEVTDDFLRQLVFGSGAAGDEGDEEDDDAFMMDDDDDDDWDGLDQEDGEMWRLLTDEEKAAIKASRRRGTARRRKPVDTAAEVTRTHAADGTEYPQHDVTQRALDRQFTEMMREFNADARLNDAYTDDPRTYGALPMEKYLTALEEFVTDRAGVDVETAEPHKNKGLIQQLRYLSHHAGAFDSDERGTFMTTTLGEKQQKFVEEFLKGTEEIRRAARQRVAQRERAAAAAAAVTGTTVPASTATAAAGASPEAAAVPPPLPDSEPESEEEMIVLEVKPKVDRLDCETAVSAYSTYYNQPNVIQAPRKSNPNRRTKKAVGVVKGNVISAADSADAGAQKKTAQKPPVEPSSSDDEEEEYHATGTTKENNGSAAPVIIPTVRPKGETKEEKKLRRQAVKAAQRERRQAKSALKSIYKDVESDEVKRSATSQAARRTVHFM